MRCRKNPQGLLERACQATVLGAPCRNLLRLRLIQTLLRHAICPLPCFGDGEEVWGSEQRWLQEVRRALETPGLIVSVNEKHIRYRIGELVLDGRHREPS